MEILRVTSENRILMFDSYLKNTSKMNLLERENPPVMTLGLEKVTVEEHKGQTGRTNEKQTPGLGEQTSLSFCEEYFQIYNIPYLSDDKQIVGTIIIERGEDKTHYKYRVGFQVNEGQIKPEELKLKGFLHSIYWSAKREAQTFMPAKTQ